MNSNLDLFWKIGSMGGVDDLEICSLVVDIVEYYIRSQDDVGSNG